jgi:hypothetical protein
MPGLVHLLGMDRAQYSEMGTGKTKSRISQVVTGLCSTISECRHWSLSLIHTTSGTGRTTSRNQ